MDLMWGVVALTVATFTVLLAVRQVLMVGSQLVFSRYVAVGGLVAFSTDRHDAVGVGVHHVRFEVGGPAVFHNVTLHLFGVPELGDGAELQRPAVQHTRLPVTTRSSGRFSCPMTRAWVMVTWVRPYLQGVESEALAQWLTTGRLYEWRWYSETTRYVRTVLRFVARQWSVPAGESIPPPTA